MTNVAIPDWSAQGVLPPINSASPTSFDRSPYQVSLTDTVSRYGTSTERRAMLGGLLQFRAALQTTGFVQGFQWIDGSFLENVEQIEDRKPRDIDVVTFFRLPGGQTQEDLVRKSPRLFHPVHTKEDYHVDAYFVLLDSGPPEDLVWQSAYWYSLWSHRRNGQWKGYLQMDLSVAEDPIAKAVLDNMKNHGGGQS